MRIGKRSLGEEFMYDRTRGKPDTEQKAPPDPRRRVDGLLRYLGVILPLAVAYGLGLFYFGAHHNQVGFYVTKALAAALWLGFAAALMARRDWVGTYVVTGVYVFLDGWMWLAVQD
jgi:hypothetical protein